MRLFISTKKRNLSNLSYKRHPRKKKRKPRRQVNEGEWDSDASGDEYSSRPLQQHKREQVFSDFSNSELPTDTSTLSEFLDTVELYDTSVFGETIAPFENNFQTLSNE